MLNNSRKAEDGDGKQKLSSAAALCTPVSSLVPDFHTLLLFSML